jgi:hypothetical protein
VTLRTSASQVQAFAGKVAAPLALDVGVVAEEVAVVEAAVEKIQDAIEVSPVEGKLVASRLVVVLPRKVAELAVGEDAVVAVVARSLDIVVLVLAEERLEEGLALGDLACAVEDHVRAVGEGDHYEDCR